MNGPLDGLTNGRGMGRDGFINSQSSAIMKRGSFKFQFFSISIHKMFRAFASTLQKLPKCLYFHKKCRIANTKLLNSGITFKQTVPEIFEENGNYTILSKI